MTPVAYLSDAFLANGAEPWRIPDIADLPNIAVENWTVRETFRPYDRDPVTLARPWAIPGTPGLEHRIGGLEKADGHGNVSYDPDNHQRMTELRARKIAGIVNDIPDLQVLGPSRGELLILGWGSTYGPIRSAVEILQAEGLSVAHAHLRHLNPFPRNTGDVATSYRRVLIPEMNLGQLRLMIRERYLVDAVGFNRVRGKSFRISEIEDAARQMLQPGRSRPMTDTDDLGVPRPAEAARTRRSLTRKDFVSDQEVRWCPGCGDYSILAQTQKVHAGLRRTRGRTSCSSPASAAPAGCRTT